MLLKAIKTRGKYYAAYYCKTAKPLNFPVLTSI